MQERNRKLIARKQKYQWEHHEHSGLPGFIDTSNQNLSLDENFESVKNVHFTNDVLKSGKFLIGAVIDELEHGLKESDFKALAIKLKSPSDDPDISLTPHTWNTDEEFGRSLLNGINPVVIEKCTSLPENFPVKNDDVNPSLNRGKSLEQEIEVSKN